mgnify:CR=1 FL=1
MANRDNGWRRSLRYLLETEGEMTGRVSRSVVQAAGTTEAAQAEEMAQALPGGPEVTAHLEEAVAQLLSRITLARSSDSA